MRGVWCRLWYTCMGRKRATGPAGHNFVVTVTMQGFEEMAAEEGQVIGCHTTDVWTVQLNKAKESNKLIVIDFTASWCPPCRVIAPIFADFAKKFMSSAIFFKVDVDELQTVAQELGVEAMPTFVFMKGGEVVDKVVGARKEDLHATIVKHTGVATA